MASKTYRFVVCVDINATNLTEAYGHLREAMDAAQDNAQGYWEGWESTDEAFGPDNDGAISPDMLQNARGAYYNDN